MEETLISFKTAELAKDKGFNIATVYGYDNNGSLKEYFTYASYSPGEPEIRIEDFICKWEYQAPTQGLLQKWLREVHKIVIEINWNQFSNKYYFCLKIPVELIKESLDFETYEETLELGLFEALKLIK